jgi:hypothetical protein
MGGGFNPGPSVPSTRCSRFQNGARVLRKSIMNSVACRAALRWAEMASTSTIRPPGRISPWRWITVAPRSGQRSAALPTTRSISASAMPG